MFKMQVRSQNMININLTYGMFASLRHIQLEVNEALRRIKEGIKDLELDQGVRAGSVHPALNGSLLMVDERLEKINERATM